MTSRLKVLFVLHKPAGGGAERVMLDVLGALDRQRFAPELVFLKTERGPYEETVPEDVRVHVLQASKSTIIVARLAKLIKRQRPNVILSTLFKNNLYTILASMVTGQEVGVVLREANNPTLTLDKARNTLIAYVKKRIYALAYPQADHFIAISYGVRDDMIDSFSIPGDKISVIYNPVDVASINRMAHRPVNHPWLRETSHIPVILTAARLVEQKGLDILLNAFAISSQSIRARLIVLGQGALKEKLEALSQDLGISDRVDFAGFQENPYAYMMNSQLFVLSSRWEGLGLVILEAMSVGTPVISTDCAFGPSELISHGETGLLVPIENPQALAEAIIHTLSHPEHAVEMTARARQFVESFKLTKITRQYESVLEAVSR